MERYLEGEEISHEETVGALKTGVTEGHVFPVTCGAATRNLGINRLLDAFVEDLPSPAKKGAGGARRASGSSPTESKDMVAFVFKTLADPYAGRINLFRVYQGVIAPRLARPQLPRARQGAHRPAARAPGQGVRARRRVRARRHRRRGQAQGDPRRRRALRQRRRDPAAAARDAAAGDGVRHRGQGQGRRGEDGPGAAPPPGGGSDDRLPPRRADRRADRGRHHADPRRGDRRTA